MEAPHETHLPRWKLPHARSAQNADGRPRREMGSRNLQRAVGATYRKEQENGLARPTEKWHDAASAAVEAAFQKETTRKDARREYQPPK